MDPERLLTRPFVLLLCVQFCFGLSYSTFFLLPKFLARQLGFGLIAKSYGYPIVFLATGVLAWSAVAFLPKQASGRAA